jgi:hypothetical protein
MNNCPACGAEYRKGSLVWLLTKEGLKRKRVCGPCVRLGATVVAPVLLPTVKERQPLLFPENPLSTARRSLVTYAAAERSAFKQCLTGGALEQAAHHQSKAEGLEVAIETLDSVTRTARVA